MRLLAAVLAIAFVTGATVLLPGAQNNQPGHRISVKLLGLSGSATVDREKTP
ncbi:hypothetical protein [Telmatospirillum sp.]|uniref:hypothetical protein n=1 Tax=Telmatospirillum sp. TaxID=2079197 RepID=UPI00284ED1C7|nr:hypothetical protein [Telmatospirillum sp.]MDR3441223.1 hypothetical protein [Telmatospirillum sp.]